MNGFYVSRLSVIDDTSHESIIELSDGLNIIYGPSNTGKTYIIRCIDYLFGSDYCPLEEEKGYKIIKMTVVSRKAGSFIIQRELKSKNATISESTINQIENGIYSVKSKRFKTIYLSLIGISESVNLVSKKDYTKTQKLSWRMLEPMFFIHEDHIFRSDSIITHPKFNNITVALSALKYCYDGEMIDIPNINDKTAINISKKAISTYISDALEKLKREKNECEMSIIDREEETNIMEELDKKDKELEALVKEGDHLSEQNKKLFTDKIETEDKLQKLLYMQNRYKVLLDGYHSDVKRLEFIIEGENLWTEQSKNATCPFCSGIINQTQHKSLLSAAKEELENLKLQSKELELLIDSNDKDINMLKSRIDEVIVKQNNITNKINNYYKPKTEKMRNVLSKLKKDQELRVKMEYMSEIIDTLSENMRQINSAQEITLTYNPRALIDDDFFDRINNYLDESLRLCKYDDFKKCVLDKLDMDVEIDGKKKKNQGKGYRAFFNSILAYNILKILTLDGVYSPGILVLDSPILSLKEANEQISEKMKGGLFKLMLETDFPCQILIVENEIPKINYTSANLIHFTKDRQQGRYGFLIDY